MRAIDADALKKTLEDMCSASNNIKQRQVEDTMLHNIFPQIIDDEPTIEAEPDNGWISVKDRLPPYGERVLVVNEAYEAERRYTKYNCGVTVRDPHLDFTFCGHKVTCWQPLPVPPKGE